MDPFWYKIFIVLVLVIAQGALWAWAGLEAQQKLPWWPIKSDMGVVNPSAASSQPATKTAEPATTEAAPQLEKSSESEEPESEKSTTSES